MDRAALTDEERNQLAMFDLMLGQMDDEQLDHFIEYLEEERARRRAGA